MVLVGDHAGLPNWSPPPQQTSGSGRMQTVMSASRAHLKPVDIFLVLFLHLCLASLPLDILLAERKRTRARAQHCPQLLLPCGDALLSCLCLCFCLVLQETVRLLGAFERNLRERTGGYVMLASAVTGLVKRIKIWMIQPDKSNVNLHREIWTLSDEVKLVKIKT